MTWKPETKRWLISAVLMAALLGGLVRFFSGELTRKDELHSNEKKELLAQLERSKSTVNTLREELKEINEKKRIIRTKDKDGNEREEIQVETDTAVASSQTEQKVVELERKVVELKEESDYLRKQSTPIGQAGAGYTSHGDFYVGGSYVLFGPAAVEGHVILEPNDPVIMLGIKYIF